MVTFAVDDVDAVLTPLPRASFDLKTVLGADVLATSPNLEDVVAAPNLDPFFGANGFAVAVHLAFSQHRPLTLSPDAVWLAILQGFALHVREHEAELRERFVRQQGKKTISLKTVDETGWSAIVDGFVAALGEEINPGLLKALSDRFSTTGETEHTAHCIAVMDSFSRFFDYELVGICGIPSVTLLGATADWTALRLRFRVLAEYGLQWWADRLEPVLEQFVEAAEGRANREFWKAIYKPAKAYGGEQATGWLVRLFPYLESDDGTLHRNEMRSVGAADEWIHEPIRPSLFPKGLSKATVRVLPESHLRTLCSGFFGVRQDEAGALLPQIGWAVLDEPTAKLWSALSAAHALPPPRSDRELHMSSGVPALLFEFYSRFDGGPIYDGALSLTPAPHARNGPRDSRMAVPLRVEGTPREVRVVTLFGIKLGVLRDGGELILVREGKPQKEFVILRKSPTAPPPWDVVANSLLELYQRLAEVKTFPPWELKGSWSPEPEPGS